MATVTWTGAGDGTTFSSAANWSPNTVPGNDGNTYVINKSATLTLTSSTTIGGFTVTGSAAVSFTGAYTFTTTGIFEFAAGSTVTLASSTTLKIGSTFTPTGTGNFTISGGTVTNQGSFNLAAGQNLLLSNTSFTDASPIGGAGTLTLGGSTTVAFTGSPPTAAVVFSGSNNVLNLPQWPSGLVLENFSSGDQLSLSGQVLKLVSTGTSNSSGQTIYNLEDTNGDKFGTVTLQSGLAGSSGEPSGYTIALTNSSGTDYTYPCFYAGTMLATEQGEIAVEDITAGMRLKTASGEILPVRWLGRSEVSTCFADPLKVLPIRIKAGALAEGLPARDLLVSPDHAMFLGGVLVQAGALVNGTSILREENVPECFTYYHVELATHELLLAEGAATESFVDNVGRMNFHNWDSREALHAPIVEMEYPRAKSHRQVPEALRRALAARAARFGVAAAA
jgi:hypothetical protein